MRRNFVKLIDNACNYSEPTILVLAERKTLPEIKVFQRFDDKIASKFEIVLETNDDWKNIL